MGEGGAAKATVVDPYPSPPTASSRLRAAYECWLRVLQYCRLIIPHVILGVLRHGSSPRQPRLGWYDHRLYRQEVYLENKKAKEGTRKTSAEHDIQDSIQTAT
ncbi:hypothetical protein Bbelb_407140 [Branchiostoma belcheri]|nr:hypothetical protein Bbelb_407140 [Branchiostoma belcheri]